MASPSVSLRADVPKDKGDIRYGGRTTITRPPVKATSWREKKLVRLTGHTHLHIYSLGGRVIYIYVCVSK